MVTARAKGSRKILDGVAESVGRRVAGDVERGSAGVVYVSGRPDRRLERTVGVDDYRPRLCLL